MSPLNAPKATLAYRALCTLQEESSDDIIDSNMAAIVSSSKPISKLSTGVLRFRTDLSTFHCRKVGIFMAINWPLYGIQFMGSQYNKNVNYGAT